MPAAFDFGIDRRIQDRLVRSLRRNAKRPTERQPRRTTMPRALIAVAVVSIAMPIQLLAQGKGMRLWNLTTSTITGFELSPAGKNAWGPNQTLNDKDKEVDHDERLRITGIEPGRYDARVSYGDARRC